MAQTAGRPALAGAGDHDRRRRGHTPGISRIAGKGRSGPGIFTRKRANQSLSAYGDAYRAA